MSQTLLKIVADFDVQLASGVAIGDTTATLSSATDDDSVSLPSGLYGFTIDKGQSNKEYIICQLSGTSLTSIQSISRQGVATSGFARAHRRGAKVTITDWAILSRILNNLDGTTGLNASSPIGYDGAPASLTGNQFATVNYVLSVVSGGTVTFDRQVVSNQTSGESLTANDIVYFKEADAKWYKADANLITPSSQLKLGVALSTVAIDSTVQIAISGPVSGFTGLTAGSKYYLSDTAGAISTTKGSNTIFMGWALSTTSLLLDTSDKVLPMGSLSTTVNPENILIEDNASAASTDQTQTTQNGTVEVGEADATLKKNKIAQSFIPERTKLHGVNLYKIADTGTFTGTVTISIQADSSGSPSGTALATKTITNADWLLISTGDFRTPFSSEISLTIGATYWIVIETSTSDNTNHPNIGSNTAGGYTKGSVKYKNTTDNWTAIATIDLYFKTLEGIKNQIVKTEDDGFINPVQTKQFNRSFITVGSRDISSTSDIVITHNLGVLPSVIRMRESMIDSNSSAETYGTATINESGSVTYAGVFYRTASPSGTSNFTNYITRVNDNANNFGDRISSITFKSRTNTTITLGVSKKSIPSGTSNYLVEIIA